jgi:hypothetical protein
LLLSYYFIREGEEDAVGAVEGRRRRLVEGEYLIESWGQRGQWGQEQLLG